MLPFDFSCEIVLDSNDSDYYYYDVDEIKQHQRKNKSKTKAQHNSSLNDDEDSLDFSLDKMRSWNLEEKLSKENNKFKREFVKFLDAKGE